MSTVRIAAVFVVLGSVAVASPAAAQTISGVRLEGHLDLGLKGDPGVGMRVDIPIVPDGFLDSTTDELALSPGADLLIGGGDPWFAIPVAAQWNLYFEQKWSVFPEVGLALLAGKHHRKSSGVALDFLIALGGRYHFAARNAVVLRLGWPVGIQLGMTF